MTYPLVTLVNFSSGVRPMSSLCAEILKVSILARLLYKVTIEITFERLCVMSLAILGCCRL